MGWFFLKLISSDDQSDENSGEDTQGASSQSAENLRKVKRGASSQSVANKPRSGLGCKEKDNHRWAPFLSRIWCFPKERDPELGENNQNKLPRLPHTPKRSSEQAGSTSNRQESSHTSEYFRNVFDENPASQGHNGSIISPRTELNRLRRIKCISPPKSSQDSAIIQLMFSLDGKYLAAMNQEGNCHIYDYLVRESVSYDPKYSQKQLEQD